MMGAPIVAVLFDLDGTLVDRGRGDRRGPPTACANGPVASAVLAVSRLCRLGIVSDGSAARQRAKLAASGLAALMSVVVISAEVGAQKPAAKIFQHALAELGSPAGQTLFVGDDLPRDIHGARAAGLKTCWVSHGRPLPPTEPAPDLIVETVADLPEALRC